MSIIIEALQDGLDELGLPGAHVGNDEDSVYAMMVVCRHRTYYYGEFCVRATISDGRDSVDVIGSFNRCFNVPVPSAAVLWRYGSVSLHHESFLEEIHERFRTIIGEFRIWLEVRLHNELKQRELDATVRRTMLKRWTPE